jgi:hypothetical protein
MFRQNGKFGHFSLPREPTLSDVALLVGEPNFIRHEKCQNTLKYYIEASLIL